MIAALKCISMVGSKSINSTHLAFLYEELCRKLGEKPSWDLYNNIHQLMNYNPNNFRPIVVIDIRDFYIINISTCSIRP